MTRACLPVIAATAVLLGCTAGTPSEPIAEHHDAVETLGGRLVRFRYAESRREHALEVGPRQMGQLILEPVETMVRIERLDADMEPVVTCANEGSFFLEVPPGSYEVSLMDPSGTMADPVTADVGSEQSGYVLVVVHDPFTAACR